MKRKEIEQFFKIHPIKEMSAAKIEYAFYLNPEMLKAANEYAEKQLEKTEEDKALETVIAEVTEPDELLKLMRKSTSGLNRSAIREKVLQKEEEMLPLIKEKCMRNGQTEFIENALYIFLHGKTNSCEWIMKEYSEIRSEYLKSMLCLVLGFRGEAEWIPFLMKEVERLEREYPYESFEQGPLLAIQELAVRFL